MKKKPEAKLVPWAKRGEGVKKVLGERERERGEGEGETLRVPCCIIDDVDWTGGRGHGEEVRFTQE